MDVKIANAYALTQSGKAQVSLELLQRYQLEVAAAPHLKPYAASIIRGIADAHKRLGNFILAQDFYTQYIANATVKNTVYAGGLVNYAMMALETNVGGRDEALDLAQEAYSLRKEALGADNLETIDVMHLIGWAYLDKGKYEEAATYVTHAYNTRKKRLGKSHVKTLTSWHNYLRLATKAPGPDLPSLDEIVEQYREIIELKLALEDPNRDSTLRTMNNLADILLVLGRNQEAEYYAGQTRCYAWKYQLQGSAAIVSRLTLMEAYLYLGRSEEALHEVNEILGEMVKKDIRGRAWNYAIELVFQLSLE